MNQRLSNLLRGAGIEPLAAVGADPEVRGAELDSRRIGPGDIFFAIQGEKLDGNRFVPEALKRGATAIVSSDIRPDWVESEVAWVRVAQPRVAAGLLSRECHGRPDESLTLVGITGTNGKTTVAHLVESISIAAGRRTGRIGTVGHAFMDIERPAARTTPEAPDFYRLLSEMREESIDLVSMEVSSHALALNRVEGARFATAAFLNLSRDHLDFHESDEAYFDAKARLFESLGPQQVAVLPTESDHGLRLRDRTRARIIRFGRSEDADVRLTREHCGLGGSSAVLETADGSFPVRTFLLGRFNLDNIAAAASCALAVGISPEAITAGVLALQSVPGRMEPVQCGQPFSVLVDYAHTPDALRNLLAWTAELSENRIHLVFGCGGNRDQGKRFEMGRVAAESGAVLFLTSDNPRDEDPRSTLDQVQAGAASVALAESRTRTLVDRREAILAAIGEARSGDIVLIVGKGHETVQAIAGREVPFDDRAVAEQALERHGFSGVQRA